MAKINNPDENIENISLADIVESEEDKKILEPVVRDLRDNQTATVINNGTFLRKEPTKYSEPITILRKGTIIMIDPNGGTDEYFLATADTGVGYILKSDVIVKF